MNRKHIKIVNKTSVGRDTRVYLVDENGVELDVSSYFHNATIKLPTNEIVKLELVSRIVELDISTDFVEVDTTDGR